MTTALIVLAMFAIIALASLAVFYIDYRAMMRDDEVDFTPGESIFDR